MPFETFYPLPGSQYNEGIILEEYNEEYSLILAQKPQGNGTVYKRWVFPEYKKEPSKKAIPWKITLGNQREAVAALKHFLGLLTNEQEGPPF